MLPQHLEKIYKNIAQITPSLLKEQYLREAGLLKQMNLNKLPRILFDQKSIQLLQLYNPQTYRDKAIFFEIVDYYLNYKLMDQYEVLLKKLYSPINMHGRTISFQKLQDLILNPYYQQKKECLFNLFINRLTEVDSLLKKLFVSRWEILQEKFNFNNPLEFYALKKGLDYNALNKIFSALSKEIDDFYKKCIWEWIENNFSGKYSYKNSPRSYIAVELIASNDFISYFSSTKQVKSFLNVLDRLDLMDIFIRSVKIDSHDRTKKTSRPACFAVNIPGEIYIITRKRNGYESYRALFHEGGHATCLATIPSRTPFYKKYWTKSGAIFELPAFLFESLIRNPLWLQQEMKIPHNKIRNIIYYGTLYDLFLLKRYIAKFFYEFWLYKENLTNINFKKAQVVYSHNLTRETGFLYNKTMYLYDIDPGIYSADYVRAWIGRESLINYLESNFSPKWFNNKRAGIFLKKLWQNGFQKDMEELFADFKITDSLNYKDLIQKYKSLIS